MLEDGREQSQFWFMDFSDQEDILRPNYVTADTLAAERERYADQPLVQQLYHDIWFKEYFKGPQTGRYIDNMGLPEDRKTHLEKLHDGEDLFSGWVMKTIEGGIGKAMHDGIDLGLSAPQEFAY